LLPQDRKENTLQTIGQNFGFQSTEKESLDTGFGQDALHHLRVAQLIGMRLFVHFDDTNGIAASVANGGAAETENGASTEFLELRVLFGDLFRQEIVREEPAVVLVLLERQRCMDFL